MESGKVSKSVSLCDGLTPAQWRGIEALATSKSITEAAEKAGVNRQAIHLWLKDPAFKAGLRDISEETFVGLSLAMLTLAARVPEVYTELFDNPATPGALVKRAAANDVVTHVVKLRELLTFEDRLAAIEATLAERGMGR